MSNAADRPKTGCATREGLVQRCLEAEEPAAVKAVTVKLWPNHMPESFRTLNASTPSDIVWGGSSAAVSTATGRPDSRLKSHRGYPRHRSDHYNADEQRK